MALLAAACLLSTEEELPTHKEKGFDGLAVPLVSYNSDLGYGIGAAGGAFFYSPGYKPFRHAVSAQVFFTTRGVQNHFLRYDGPRLLGHVRTEARLEFRRELLSPYYGAGNQALSGVDVEPDNREFNYRRLSPGAWARGRIKPLGQDSPFEVHAGYSIRWTKVELFDNSVLSQEKPLGLEGGFTGQFQVGLLWDTRNVEGDPTRGGLEELSYRVAAPATGSRYSFSGLTLSSRRVFRLGSENLLLAQRILFDTLWGDVPFFEWPYTGGLNPSEGVGGMSSVRGILRNRFVGNTKAFVNSEIRYYPWAFPLFKVKTKVGGLVFVDLGRTWHPGIDDGSFWNWHPAVGAGIRLARRQAVVRLDTGYAFESKRLGIYVTFGHMF